MAYNIPADFLSGGIINAEDHNNIKNSIDALKGGTARTAPTRTVEAINTLVNTYSNHSNLSNLNQDTHTQYPLVAGTRPFTGKIQYNDNKVFTDDKDIIARKFVTDLDAQNVKLTGNQTVAGAKLFSGSITAAAGATIVEFSTDGTLAGNSDTVLPTEQAVKTYIGTGLVPTGTILSFAADSVPAGFLAADFSAVSRITYAALFAVIGSTWGVGNGTTTFNLPDNRAAYLRGTGTHGTNKMADNNYYAGPAVGAYENDKFQSFQVGSAADTTGARNYYGQVYTRDAVNSSAPNAGSGVVRSETSAQGVANRLKAMNDGTYGDTRSGDETMPFNAGVKFIIKY